VLDSELCSEKDELSTIVLIFLLSMVKCIAV